MSLRRRNGFKSIEPEESGHEFIRASDRELWAVERDDALVSARSGALLAQRRGRVYFAVDTDEPLYYERAI